MPGIRTLEGFVTILPGLQRPCLALECFTMIKPRLFLELEGFSAQLYSYTEGLSHH